MKNIILTAVTLWLGVIGVVQAGVDVEVEPTSNNYDYIYNFNINTGDGSLKYTNIIGWGAPAGLNIDLNCNAKPQNISIPLDVMTTANYHLSELSSCKITIKNKSGNPIYVNRAHILTIGSTNEGLIGNDGTVTFYLNGNIPSDVTCNVSAPAVMDVGDISNIKQKKRISNMASSNIVFDCGGNSAFVALTSNNIRDDCASSGKGIMYCLKINDVRTPMGSGGTKTSVNNGSFMLSVTPEGYGDIEIGEHNAIVSIQMSVN